MGTNIKKIVSNSKESVDPVEAYELMDKALNVGSKVYSDALLSSVSGSGFIQTSTLTRMPTETKTAASKLALPLSPKATAMIKPQLPQVSIAESTAEEKKLEAILLKYSTREDGSQEVHLVQEAGSKPYAATDLMKSTSDGSVPGEYAILGQNDPSCLDMDARALEDLMEVTRSDAPQVHNSQREAFVAKT